MKFLEQSFDKQNQLWKYLVVFFGALFGGQIIGGIPLIIVTIVQGNRAKGEGIQQNPENIMDFTGFGISKNVALFLMMLSMVVVLFFAIFLIKALHKRSFAQTVNGTAKIRWKRVGAGAAFWALAAAVSLGIGLIFNSDAFELQFNLAKFIPLMIVSLIMIPLQTTGEELLFRGYLTQGMAGWTHNRLLSIMIPGILFALLHSFNPEIKEFGFWAMIPQYLMIGILYGLVAVLDDGIELAVGMHAANNVFISLFITQKHGVLQTDAVFYQTIVDVCKDNLETLVMCIIVVAFFAWKYKWDFRMLNKKVRQDTGNDATLL